MNKILNRDEFIKEIYNPMVEQKEYENLQKINEGILSTLFGKIKNLFKKDWETIKGDKGIIQVYKELDDKLTGYSTMKLSKKDQCNKIRQELVDFACMWYDMKKNSAKESKNIEPAKSFKFKDDTLKESLEKCQKVIKEIANGDTQMIKWAQILMDDMKIVINQVILNEIEDEELKNEIKKQNEEAIKKTEEKNKKAEKIQSEELQKIEEERKEYITNAGADPVDSKLLGDKVVQNVNSEFDNVYKVFDTDKKNMEKALQQSKFLGLDKLYDDVIKDSKTFYKEDNFETSMKMMELFYKSLSDPKVSKKFEEVPGASVQAMCIAVDSFIKNSIYGNNDYSNEIDLMAKCAIVSNGTISYNLPLNKKGDGNYFTEIVTSISNGKFTAKSDIELPDDFKKNSTTMLKKIVDEAKKLKEKGEKEYNDRMKKLNSDDKKSESSIE